MTRRQMDKPYRVVIAEDHTVTSWGLAFLLSGLPDYEVVDHVEDGNGITSALQRHTPDLLILDLALPGKSGMEVLESPGINIPVLVLSGQAGGADFERAYRAGAQALVSKGDGPEEIIAALAALIRGDAYVSKTVKSLIGSPD